MHRQTFREQLTLAAALVVATASLGYTADYRVGDRLPGTGSKEAPRNTSSAKPFREIDWLALVPKNWDPAAEIRSLDLANMKDDDPRAVQALQRLKDAVRNAPVMQELEGARVRIPGFSIPLERSGDKVSEFLLVPYFGACIHVPPPPPNQIIHVTLARPVTMQMMQALVVSGTMRIVRADTQFGRVAYAMDADSAVPYDR